MSKRTESSRAQTLFLRAFRDNSAGPQPKDWPTPAVLKRWLKNDSFRKSLALLRDALRVQADFHIASAANAAAQSIHTTFHTGGLAASSASPSPDNANPPPDFARQLKPLTDLLRLAHIRHRFAADAPAVTDHAADTNTPSNGSDGHRTYSPNVPWNPHWFDAPHHIATIFCDPDKSRLKSYMLLLTMRGRKGWEPFLAAFPDELAAAQANAAKHHPQPG